MAVQLREMLPSDRMRVAELIYHSTNAWYTAAGRTAIFQGDPAATALFFDIYHALPGSGGLVAEDAEDGALLGSCFYHVRSTHVSLGIMNAHPAHFGRGVARMLLERIIQQADQAARPLRLVSSAMNLDSFSLYTRRGFVPRAVYQDMYVPALPEGARHVVPLVERVRPATLEDVDRIVDLEWSVSHIRREGDYRHFIANPDGIWHVSVIEDGPGRLGGVLASCVHPACNMLGPGVARTAEQAGALIAAELNYHAGRTPVFLVPADCTPLVQSLYRLGARNCELHFAQVRGHWPGVHGVCMPTFMPESG